MRKTHYLATTLITTFILLLAPKALSTILEFSPADQSVNLGQSVQVDVFASDPGGNLIGAYDFFVDYDPAILNLLNITYGTGLGGPADSLRDVITSTGSANVAELSLLPDFSGSQSGASDLLLFSLSFESLSTGTSDLSFRENILGVAGGFLADDLGAPLFLDTIGTGLVSVLQAPVNVTEPTAILLICVGLASLTRARNTSLNRF